MMFALELARRLAGTPTDVRATAAHPGYTATELQRTSSLVRSLNPLFGMKAPQGALPTLRAATDPEAENGSYWGPAHAFEIFGPPVPAAIPRVARDEAVAARLWDVSEKLAGVSFGLPAVAGGQAVA